MKRGRAARGGPVDDHPTDAIGPAGRQDRGAGHVCPLGADGLCAPDPDFGDRGVAACRVHDLGGEIDRMPPGQRTVDAGEGAADRRADVDRHGRSLPR